MESRAGRAGMEQPDSADGAFLPQEFRRAVQAFVTRGRCLRSLVRATGFRSTQNKPKTLQWNRRGKSPGTNVHVCSSSWFERLCAVKLCAGAEGRKVIRLECDSRESPPLQSYCNRGRGPGSTKRIDERVRQYKSERVDKQAKSRYSRKVGERQSRAKATRS